jgi:DeoR/GlpR family transcriptional regulator of sugar metabolism
MARNRDTRLAAMIDHLVEVGSESARNLAARFQVSVMTVHRDLDELESRGLVRKFHGGASVTRTGSYEVAAPIRRRLAVGQKQALATAAARGVRDGQAIMIDDSTTAAAMLDPLLRSGISLRVITNYLPSLTSLAGSTRLIAEAIGGEYDHGHESYLGTGAVNAVRALRPDVVYVSTTTADAHGIYHQEERVVTLKLEMLNSARRRVLLMDETKLGSTSLHRVCGWDLIDELITTTDAPADLLTEIGDRGVTVTTVAPRPDAADSADGGGPDRGQTAADSDSR